ncbi:MAG: hypothetical protein RL266_1027, partial [Bacteroidota bacterium]
MKRTLFLLIAGLLASTYTHAQCETDQIEVAIQILTDNYGYETEWNLLDSDGNVLASGGQNDAYANATWYGDTVCVDENECMRFEIFDSFGDGICCGYGQGSYAVLIDGQEVASGGDFDSYAFSLFNCPPGSSCSDPFVIIEGTFTAPAANTWYSFTPSENGNYAIEACNNNCDSRIWIYDYCDGLVWADDNTGSIYYDDDQGGCGPQAMIGGALLEGGVEYWIRIGTDNNDCSGTIDWSLTYNGPVVG